MLFSVNKSSVLKAYNCLLFVYCDSDVELSHLAFVPHLLIYICSTLNRDGTPNCDGQAKVRTALVNTVKCDGVI